VTLLDRLVLAGSELYIGISPIPTGHPPSLKVAKKKTALVTDGWKKGASRKARRAAMKDMAQALDLLRKQVGQPQAPQSAVLPVYPGTNRGLY
jgi:hypothetical protein